MRPVTEYIRRLLSEMRGNILCGHPEVVAEAGATPHPPHYVRHLPLEGKAFLRRGCFLLSHRLPFEGKLPFIKIKPIKSEHPKELGRRALVERRGGPACREKGYGFYYSDLTLFASWPLKSDEICTPYP